MSTGSASSGAVKPADTNPPKVLPDTSLPALFTVADEAAIKAQAQYFAWLSAELILLTLAAAVALLASFRILDPALPSFTLSGFTIPSFSLVVLLSAACFAAAFVVRFVRNARQFETRWYETRAAAESVKSAAWRFAVGGRPFPLDGDEPAAEARFLQRLKETLTDVAKDLGNAAFTTTDQVTPAMGALRKQLLETRREAYRKERIADQENYYKDNAMTNQNRGGWWHWTLIVLEVAGAVATGLVAFHPLPISPQGVIAAIVSGIISWTQAKRYQYLYASYSVAVSELTTIEAKIPDQTAEGAWSTFVDEAEEACSREHRLWRATHDD